MTRSSAPLVRRAEARKQDSEHRLRGRKPDHSFATRLAERAREIAERLARFLAPERGDIPAPGRDRDAPSRGIDR